MTREEYIRIVQKYDVPTIELIDAIFDDFESRTCENCEHFNKVQINEGVIECFHLGDIKTDVRLTEYFGCNQWEANEAKDNR